MKKIILLYIFLLFLLHYNIIYAQHLKIENISTYFQKVKINEVQEDSNRLLVKGYCFQDMFFKIVIKISGKDVFYRKYEDFPKIKTEYMENDGKYYKYNPAIIYFNQMPMSEDFDKWYSRKDTQIIQKVKFPTIVLFDKGPQMFRFQIVYAYYTSKDERSRKLLKSEWIYMEFEK